MAITELKNKILQVLAEDDRTQDYAFEIIDESGLITIKGVVDSRQAKQAALEIIKKQKGVIEVVDEIELTAEPDENLSPVPNPEKIKYQVNQ